MSSKYDSIKTAADLVAEVAACGLSTDQDDINRAADIFGNTSVEELDRLANDIGRNNDKGEPDPHGSWSSSRKPTQETFYMIAFSVWNWVDATRFWNLHTNQATAKARETETRNQQLKMENQKLKERRDQLIEEQTKFTNKVTELYNEVSATKLRAEQAEKTVTELKAKLYDYMTGEEKAQMYEERKAV